MAVAAAATVTLAVTQAATAVRGTAAPTATPLTAAEATALSQNVNTPVIVC